MENWHSCQGSQDARARVDKMVQERLKNLKRVAEGNAK
jgi:hypothetical protein